MSERTFTPRDFRDALSSFATGVTIVTARDADGEAVGMTASSFNSVSMNPPLVLWSVTKKARSAPAFHDAEHFAVHVLASDQVDLSNVFARSGADKFAGLDYSGGIEDVPHLKGAATRFHCRRWAVYEGGDHWIIVGEVLDIERANAESLVFGNGAYATAAPIRPPDMPAAASSPFDSAIDNLLIYNLSRAYHQLGSRFHRSVRDSGLTISEWRILASLHGKVTREFADLAERTFVDPKALADMVAAMEEEGLCNVQEGNGAKRVQGTPKGHERVAHLFELGEEQEREALSGSGVDGMEQLIDLLKTVVKNTG